VTLFQGVPVLGFVSLLLHAASVPIQPGIGFEQNKGQFSSDILFAARPIGYVSATSLVVPPVSIQWAGGNAASAVTPSDPVPFTVNVFTGADPSKWITGIRRYAQVRCPFSASTVPA
jgi:hypothetical protein